MAETPAAEKAVKVTLDSTMVEAAVTELKELDERIAGVIGTAAEMQKKAEEATKDNVMVDVPSEVTDNLKQFVGVLTNKKLMAEQDGKVAAQTVDLLDMAAGLLRDHVAEARSEAVTAWLKDNAKDTGPGLEALRKQRDEKVETIKALAVVLKVPQPDIPSAPKSKSSRSGNGGSVKISGAAYYKVENGSKNYISENQNKVSSVAFYWGSKLMGTDTKPGVGDFAEWAKKEHNVDVKQATPWSITANGITVGMDVISPDAPAAAVTETAPAADEKKEEAKA